jgi:dTDP-4-dehydrorhamnose 3,5-epimerase
MRNLRLCRKPQSCLALPTQRLSFVDSWRIMQASSRGSHNVTSCHPSSAAGEGPAQLPIGVALRPLPGELELCGAMTSLYRRDRPAGPDLVQWNLVSSRANTFRGVHVHLTHSDYLCVISGEMLLGLHDMRPWSPTYKLAVHQRLRGEEPCSIAIPPRVAHGFYFPSEAIHIYAVSHYWNPADELGCRWDDADLGLSWPTKDPLLSPRDAGASSYRELARALNTTHTGHVDHP